MTNRRSSLWHWVASFLLAAGCSHRPEQPPPEAEEKPKVESELAFTTLSPEAAKSLGIRTEVLQQRMVQDHLPLTGWIMARQGLEVTVTTPVGGYVRLPADPKTVPMAGGHVNAEQELFSLEPVLSPLEQAQMADLRLNAAGELAKARVSIALAEKELKRLKGLEELKQQQEVEQAEARVQTAKAEQGAAEEKLKLYGGADNSSSLKALSIRAPRAGTVLAVPGSPGQYVPAGATLATVADLSQPWVRVPIPEQLLPQVNATGPADFVLKTAGNQTHFFQVRPLALVPQVDPVRHTADMIYEILAEGSKEALPRWAKDQMVTMFVPLNESRQEWLAPYSAVVFDAYGSSWIYLEQKSDTSGPQVYQRRRVELGPMVNDDVVIRPAGQPGEHVVIAGAAALFSREFASPPTTAGQGKKDSDDND